MEVLEPQILDTGRFGLIQVVKGPWVMKGKSIVKLVNGAFVYTTGLPISHKKEITEVIPPGPDQDEALYWFDHRHDGPEAAEGRRIIMNHDGSYEFEDGEEITELGEIIQAIKSGPQQEVVVRWFLAEQDKKRAAQAKQPPEWQKPAQGEEVMPATPKAARPKKNVKRPAPKKSAPKLGHSAGPLTPAGEAAAAQGMGGAP